MAYCTSAEIQAAIGGSAALIALTDPLNASLNTAAVSSAIDEATGLIDMYATGTGGATGTAGALWSTTPTQATQCAINIAVYTLYIRIWREAPPDWTDRYTRSMDLLERLSTGKVSWVASQDPPQQNVGRVYYFTANSTNRSDTPNRRTTRGSLDKL